MANRIAVSNVTRSSTNLRKMTPGLKKCFAYVKEMGEDPESLLPEGDKLHLDFTISNACTGLANAIRITLMEECPVKSMEFNLDDFNTTDKYILPEFLGERLQAIPINQDANYEGVTVILDMENKTREPIEIMSRDLLVKKGKKELDNSKYFQGCMTIHKLNPGRSVKAEMKIVEGLARDDGNKFANVSNIRYETLDGGKEVLMSTYTKFRIGFSTFRNSSIELIVDKMHQSLVNRLKKYVLSLDDLADGKMSEHLVVKGNVFVFPEEYRSVPAMLAHYCYLIDPDLPSVSSTVKHPSSDTGLVRLVHPQPIKLLRAAALASISDLDVLRKELA